MQIKGLKSDLSGMIGNTHVSFLREVSVVRLKPYQTLLEHGKTKITKSTKKISS